MEEAKKVEDANFRYHHHALRCMSNDTDPFVQASYRRKSLAQFFYASRSLCEVDATCHFIDKRAQIYNSIVDERTEKSINNYADASLSLASNFGINDATKWKSKLRESRPVTLVVKKLTQCPGQCSNLNVTSEDLKLLSKGELKEYCEDNQDHETLKRKITDPTQQSNLLAKGQVPSHGSFEEKQQGPISREPSAQGSSFNAMPIRNEPNSNFGYNGRQVPFNGSSHGRGSVSRSCSNDFEFSGSGTSWRKDGVAAGVTSRDSNLLGGRGVSFSAPNSRGRGQGVSFHNVGQKTFQSGYGEDPQPANNFSRSSGHANNVSGWNNGPNQSGSKQWQDNSSEVETSAGPARMFRTAKDELAIQNLKKYGSRGGNNSGYGVARGGSGTVKRSLGPRRAGVHGKFIPPIKPTDEDDFGGMFGVKQPGMGLEGENDEEVDERLKNIDPKMVETIRNEIMDIGAPVEWDDIAGLDFAKTTIQEIVVWPLLRPDIFTGLRKPPKGLLLFGPPGTGKTLIGKCIASQSQSTFFSISASSLTSKWIGDGEKMVRALFAVAKVHQPSVVFIDEIDSLLTQRSDTEHESSRRIKTEFLVQLDGAGTGEEERILVVGATNRPQELDEAARRRLVKRLYIPLPEFSARRQIVERLMSSERSALTSDQINEIASLTDGYSGADMKNLCQEASLGPIRSIPFSVIHNITADQVRPITVEDFKLALQRVRASVSNKDLDAYVQWDKTYGMGSGL